MKIIINNIFFFKQKTAYEMRNSDWSSDVCSSDLPDGRPRGWDVRRPRGGGCALPPRADGGGNRHRPVAPRLPGLAPDLHGPVLLDGRSGAGPRRVGRSAARRVG